MADMFVKIAGIAGESQDEVHRGQIDIASWHWRMSQQSSMMSGSGGGTGKATINDLEFIHEIDRASPNLMRYCLTGRNPHAFDSLQRYIRMQKAILPVPGSTLHAYGTVDVR